MPAVLISASISVQTSLDRVAQSELNKLQQISSTIAGQIQQTFSSHQSFAAFLSREPRLLELMLKPGDEASTREVKGRFNAVISTNPEVELLMALDTTGRVLTSSDPALIGRNFAFRDYFKTAAQGRPASTSIIVGAVAGNAGVFFSHPVFDTAGQVVGVFVIKMLARSYGELVEQAAEDKILEPFVIDGDGVIIHHANQNMLYKSLTPLSEKRQAQIAEDKRFRIERVESLNLFSLAKALANSNSFGYVNYSGPDGMPSIAGFSPVLNVGWTVVVSEPESVFRAPLEQLFQKFVWVMVVAGVVVLLLTLLAARVFVSPIKRLASAAAKVEQGDYDGAVTGLSTHDEVGQLSRAFDNMLVGIRDREKVKDVFGRMVSPEVREKLLQGTLSLGGESARVSVLFSDIRDFSGLSERMPPSEVVELLNEYLTEMSIAVGNWGGYINNFIGDAIVVVFGVPVKQENIETRAVFAALEMRERLSSLNKRRRSQGKVALKNGIGISTGEVVAGQMGSIDRFLYTVIGDAVNVAARLEGLTKEFEEFPILLNEETYLALKLDETFVAQNLGEQPVKGRLAKVKVWGIRLVAQ
ncbi:MAG: HAMP domain-containing protein [Burkholderiales bacterium]|uniref:adenylate/guanylate cyclase domain-containing protein n=1 Tax=Limnobacter sp. TaxID=2003368 RepID=UPI0039BD5412|nr:HAMP domain-containing protein [Burkholderiales bacterium]